MKASTEKKKIKGVPPVWPQNPIAAEFCKWFWSQNQGWDWIRGNAPTPEGKTQWTTESYPIQPDELWSLHQDEAAAIGVGFKESTRYCLIDLDRGSSYHPYKDAGAYERLLEALKVIGLLSPVVVRSTWSEGLHLYFPLPKLVRSFGVACAIKWCLFDAEMFLKGGQIESFPNVKSYSRNDFAQYKAHRLPLQQGSGSALLDACLEPYSANIEDLLDEFSQSAKKQNLDLLESAIADAWERQRLSRGFGSRQRADKWKRHLEKRLAAGWTAFSQTNSLIKDFATYGCVFLGLTGQTLINYVVEQVTTTPGYDRFCRHQHEIRQRATDWCRAVERYYWPYGSTATREGTYKENFNDCPTPESPTPEPESPIPENNIVNFCNQARSDQAEERVRQAVAALEERGDLPLTATARAIAIIAKAKELSGTGVSQTTLHKPKYLPLWHPDYYPKSCVIAVPEPVPANSTEAETIEIPENLEITPEPKSLESRPSKDLSKNYTPPLLNEGFAEGVFSDAPQAQSEKQIAIQGGPGGNPQARPGELAKATSARIQAAGLARGAVKLARLSSTGTDAERREAENLAGEIARMQYYWASGIEQLRQEAREWAAVNPEILPEIPPAVHSPGITAQPAITSSLPSGTTTGMSHHQSIPMSQPLPGTPWYAERIKPRTRDQSPFEIGQKVLYEGEEYAIAATSHTHSQLEGIPKAVPNFGLIPVSGQGVARGDTPLRTLP